MLSRYRAQPLATRGTRRGRWNRPLMSGLAVLAVAYGCDAWAVRSARCRRPCGVGRRKLRPAQSLGSRGPSRKLWSRYPRPRVAWRLLRVDRDAYEWPPPANRAGKSRCAGEPPLPKWRPLGFPGMPPGPARGWAGFSPRGMMRIVSNAREACNSNLAPVPGRANGSRGPSPRDPDPFFGPSIFST